MILGRWWSSRSLYVKGGVVVAVPLLTMVLLVPVFIVALRTAAARADDERVAFSTSQAADAILKDLLDAETGVRGFLLTANREFLQPYNEALDHLPGDRASLDRALAEDGGSSLELLDALAEKRLGLLASFIHDPSAATDQALEQGKVYMDQIRVISGRLASRAEAARRIADIDRRKAEHGAELAAMIVIPLSIAAAVVALTLFANGIVRRVRRNTENAERLAKGAELLPAPAGHDEIGRSGVALVETGKLLRERERSIRRSEGELRAILDSLREGVALLDRDGVVVRINPAGDEIAGFGLRQEDEAAWAARYELRSGDDRPIDVEDLPSRRAARGLSTDPVVMRIIDRTGGVSKWVLAYGCPVFDDDGAVVGGVSVVSDVTERFEADRRLQRTTEALERSNAQLREAHERLEAMAVTDALTGMLNRHGFEPLARQQLELARRSGDEVSLLFFDVDGLKKVNDELGHAIGSDLLVDTANAIRASIRAADVAVRLGGDEFCVLITGGPLAVAEVRDRVAANLADANAREGVPYRLAMSVGSATSTRREPLELESLLQRADERMYEDKRARRSERSKA